jgi:hypothetical protein
MVYRQGWPSAYFNGSRSTQSLIDFALTLACNPNYIEHQNNSRSTTADTNLEISNPNPDITDKTSSTQFTTDKPLRGYDASLPAKAVTKDEVGNVQTPGTTTTVTTTSTVSTGDIAMPIKTTKSVVVSNP